MANNPVLSPVAIGKTPVTGTAAAPVNANFTGPNDQGLLNDVPPMFGPGQDVAPLIAINGVNTPKLGLAGPESPKTHG